MSKLLKPDTLQRKKHDIKHFGEETFQYRDESYFYIQWTLFYFLNVFN